MLANKPSIKATSLSASQSAIQPSTQSPSLQPKGEHGVSELGNASEFLKKELHYEIGPMTSKRAVGPTLNVTFRGASGFLPVFFRLLMGFQCWSWRLVGVGAEGWSIGGETEQNQQNHFRVTFRFSSGFLPGPAFSASWKLLPGYLPVFFRFSSGTLCFYIVS